MDSVCTYPQDYRPAPAGSGRPGTVIVCGSPATTENGKGEPRCPRHEGR